MFYLALDKHLINTDPKQSDATINENYVDVDKKSTPRTPHEKLSHSLSKSSSKPILILESKHISYASTDEDVDDINSHYFEDIDRSTTTNMIDHRDKLRTRLLSLNNEQNGSNTNSSFYSRILSTEYSQITLDSGVDITSEQKNYQPNTTLTIDRQASEQTTDQNDSHVLSDDSLMEIEVKLPASNFLLNSSMNESLESKTNLPNENGLNDEKNFYEGYELETVTDEDDDHLMKNDTNKFTINSEISSSKSPSPSHCTIRSQFEFKLPTFREWIDRAFNTFLSQTNQNQSDSILSSQSSPILSMHTSQSTINTSSSSQMITVLDTHDLQNTSRNECIDRHQTRLISSDEEKKDEQSLNGSDD